LFNSSITLADIATVRALPLLVSFKRTDAAVHLFGTLDHGKLRINQVDAAPPEGCNLAATEAAQHGKHNRDEHAGASDDIKQGRGLRHVVGRHPVPPDLRWIYRINGIADQDLPAHGLRKGLL
jgi:hypothetical protein